MIEFDPTMHIRLVNPTFDQIISALQEAQINPEATNLDAVDVIESLLLMRKAGCDFYSMTVWGDPEVRHEHRYFCEIELYVSENTVRFSVTYTRYYSKYWATFWFRDGSRAYYYDRPDPDGRCNMEHMGPDGTFRKGGENE